MTHVFFETIDTPDGPFTAIEDEQGRVVASGWTPDAAALAEHARLREVHLTPARVAARKAVNAYYDGDLAAIDAVEVHQQGTALQTSVWKYLRTIEPGSPATYRRLAEDLGVPRASRAIGSACGRNAVALFVPCHRVVAGDGSLAGFAWGVQVKRSLLDREQRASL